jgi:hypothetical protein
LRKDPERVRQRNKAARERYRATKEKEGKEVKNMSSDKDAYIEHLEQKLKEYENAI